MTDLTKIREQVKRIERIYSTTGAAQPFTFDKDGNQPLAGQKKELEDRLEVIADRLKGPTEDPPPPPEPEE